MQNVSSRSCMKVEAGGVVRQEKGGPFELFVFVFLFIFVIVLVSGFVFVFVSTYESRWRYAKVVWGWSSGGEGGPFEAISMILGQVALPLTSPTPKFLGKGFPELQPFITCDYWTMVLVALLLILSNNKKGHYTPKWGPNSCQLETARDCSWVNRWDFAWSRGSKSCDCQQSLQKKFNQHLQCCFIFDPGKWKKILGWLPRIPSPIASTLPSLCQWTPWSPLTQTKICIVWLSWVMSVFAFVFVLVFVFVSELWYTLCTQCLNIWTLMILTSIQLLIWVFQ